jgi:hypothetical protein
MSGKNRSASPGQESEKPPPAPASDKQAASNEREDEERFEEGLAVRGEVAPPGTEPLPPGVTHETVEEKDGVPTKVRRRRFSAHG